MYFDTLFLIQLIQFTYWYRMKICGFINKINLQDADTCNTSQNSALIIAQNTLQFTCMHRMKKMEYPVIESKIGSC